MSIGDEALDPLGTCLSTYAAQLNHSCNPNCIFIFSGPSLSVRSLQSIPAGGELTISYVDTTMLRSERQEKLRSNYYFDCDCDYCRSSLTCGQPDTPESLRTKMSTNEILQLEREGRRLQALSEDAEQQEQVEILSKALKMFRPYKDIYPLWRSPWPAINFNMNLVRLGLGHWIMALAHGLKAYFYTEPVLYPLEWHPVRTVRTFVLLKIIFELGYQVNEGPNRVQFQEALKKYNVDWPVVIAALGDEINAAIPRGFGTESSFAAAFKPCWEGILSDQAKMGKDRWEGERGKLKALADDLVN